jgi:hypothetical protein
MAAALLAFCSILPAWADYQSTVLSQGPSGYWRLNETTPVANLSTVATNLGSLGTGGNGTYNGDLAGRGTTGAVAGNTAAHFDASAEFVATTLGAQTGDFSAECWFSPDQNSANLQCIFGNGDTAAGNRLGWLVYLNGGGVNTVQLRLYTGSGTGANIATVATNYTAGNFYHVVVTRTSGLFRLYVNGAPPAATTPGTYGLPAAGNQFTVATRPGPAANLANMFPGKVDEVAYYPNAIDATTVKAHFDAATTNAAGYRAQILASGPSLYYRLDEPPLPIVSNIGSLGSAANAKLVYPAVSADPGAVPPQYAGFESTNVGIAVSGTTGSQGAGGYAVVPPLNLNTNTVTITCWLKPNGGQAPFAGAIMHRAQTAAPNIGTTAGLIFDAAPGLNLAYNWDGDIATYNTATGVSINDAQWNFVALIIKPDSATFFVPGGPNPNPTTLLHTHGALKFEGSTWFGADLTKNGYNGSIDEVAIFKRALGLGEVYSQYSTAVGTNAPVVFVDPQAPASSPYAGDPLTLTVDAGGTQTNFTYQWRKASVPIGGANGSSYTIPVLAVTDTASYDVVITNNFGTVTSAGALVTVQPQAAPAITSDIPVTNRTIYAGGSIKLKIAASGGALSYQWQKGGSDIGGATTPSLTIANLVATNAGTYTCIVSNAISTATSTPAVIAIGAPGAGTYEALVAADKPVGWWRMDDAPSSQLMLDAMGNSDGYWSNTVTLGSSGALANDSNKAATFNGGANWGEVTTLPAPAALGNFTYECWVRTSDLTTEQCPWSSFRNAYGFWFQKDSGGAWRGRDGYGDLDGNSSRQDQIGTAAAGKWTHLVAIYDTVNTPTGHRVFINGRWNNDGPFLDFCRNLNTPMRVGAVDPLNQDGMAHFFTGDIDEVAVYNKALTTNQILAHYLAAVYSTNGAPVFATQPQNLTVFIGQTATFLTVIEGSPTLGQQWYKNGAIIVSNASATTPTLVLPNTTYADAIGNTYYCVATNGVGPKTSSVVTLTVLPQPAFANLTNNLVLHLKFDGDYSDSSGHSHNGTAVGSPSIAAGRVGSGALHYQTITDGSGGHGGSVLAANYVTLGSFTNGSDLSFSNNVSFSVCYWVKTISNAYGSGDLPFLCSANGSYQNKGITLAPTYSTSTAGGWSWSLGDGGTFAGLYGPAGSINNGNWHHVLHSFDRSTGRGITYLDGLSVNSTSFAILDNIDTGNVFNIGQDPTGAYNESGEYYVDDMCLWKNRVISSAEAYSAFYVGSNFGQSIDVVKPITLTVAKVSGNYWIVWQAGTLYQSGTVNGTYTIVPGAVAPYYQMPLNSTNTFYKVQ